MTLPPASPSSVLVVDDHPLYRKALADLAGQLLGQGNVAEAGSAEAGLQLGGRLTNLRLILLDFRLPGLHGVEAMTALQQRFPGVDIVVITGSEDRRDAAAALRAGAKAFLSKASSMDEISDALVAVLGGRELPNNGKWKLPDLPPSDQPAELTSRQIEILHLLCQGYSNKEIGLRLGVALVTVKTHVSAIFRALGVVNRTQAVLAARRLGLDSVAAA